MIYKVFPATFKYIVSKISRKSKITLTDSCPRLVYRVHLRPVYPCNVDNCIDVVKMTGRCLLCSGTSASFANLEPSWSDLAPSISETFFNFLRVPLTPEYADTFRNSAYCDSCFEHIVELYEIVNQLATLEGSLTRVHAGIEQSIRQSYSETLNALEPFQRPVPETEATTCLRYKLYEAIAPEPVPPETLTLYAASPGLGQSDASIQCDIVTDSLANSSTELPEFLKKSRGNVNAEITEADRWIESTESLPSTSYQIEDLVASFNDSKAEAVVDVILPKRQVRRPKRYSPEPLPSTSYQIEDLGASHCDSKPATEKALPKRQSRRLKRYSPEPEPSFTENKSGPEAEPEQPKPAEDADRSGNWEPDVAETSSAVDDVVQEDEEIVNAPAAPQDCIIESFDQRVSTKSAYIGSLFKCPHADTCKTWLKSEEDIRFHILRHHEGVRFPYKCDQCDKAFEFKNKLTTHYMLHTGERPFICEHCGFSCRAAKHLREHMTMHTGNKRYNCDVCKKGFMSQLSYLAHVRSHTKERPYICEVCGAGFITNQCLRNHQTKHEELPYGPIVCEICGKRFSAQHNLKAHLRRHNNQYEVFCPTCNKGCDNASQLERHLVCHSKERKFACDQCSKTYLLKCHLMNHLKRHSNTRAYQCNVCSKKFYERKSLNSHVLVHSGTKPFECVLCPKKFAAKSHLDIHYYSHRTPKPVRQRKVKQVNFKSRKKAKSKIVVKIPELDVPQSNVPEPDAEPLELLPVQEEVQEQFDVGLQDGDQAHFIVSDDGNNTMTLSDSIQSIVQELNAFHTETFIIEIPEDQEPIAFSDPLTQPLNQSGGITLQCNAEGVVEFCTFSIE